MNFDHPHRSFQHTQVVDFVSSIISRRYMYKYIFISIKIPICMYQRYLREERPDAWEMRWTSIASAECDRCQAFGFSIPEFHSIPRVDPIPLSNNLLTISPSYNLCIYHTCISNKFHPQVNTSVSFLHSWEYQNGKKNCGIKNWSKSNR